MAVLGQCDVHEANGNRTIEQFRERGICFLLKKYNGHIVNAIDKEGLHVNEESGVFFGMGGRNFSKEQSCSVVEVQLVFEDDAKRTFPAIETVPAEHGGRSAIESVELVNIKVLE